MNTGKILKERLNERDLVWISYLAKGYTAKMLSEAIGIPESSINQTLYLIQLKAGARNRTQLVAQCARYKLIKV